MATQLELVRRGDFSADLSTVDLLNYTDGFDLARGGWIPATPDGKCLSNLQEVITLRARGSTQDDLAEKAQDLAAKIRELYWYEDATDLYGVWLRAKQRRESNARQALVLDSAYELGSAILDESVSLNSKINVMHLGLTRTPLWEATTHSVIGPIQVNGLGGMNDYSEVVGDEPARIAQLSIDGVDGGSGALYEFWLGFRSSRYGDPANFVPCWQCEDADSSTFDADTSNQGAYLQCSFGTVASMASRFTINAEDVTTNYADQRGEYVVLLRAKVGTSTTCHVRLLTGLSSANNWRTQARVVVDSTAWLLYPIGTVAIPSSRGRDSSSFLRKSALRLQAERVSGSGSLQMDRFVLIPYAEGAIYLEGGAVQYSSGDRRPIYVRHHPDGLIDAWGYSGGLPVREVTPAPNRYGLPIGTGYVVLAAQQSALSSTLDEVRLTFQVYPRWRSLRGADS